MSSKTQAGGGTKNSSTGNIWVLKHVFRRREENEEKEKRSKSKGEMKPVLLFFTAGRYAPK